MPSFPSDRDFQAMDDLDTLRRAQELDANPGRLAKAKRFAQSESERFAAVAESVPASGRNLVNGARRGTVEPFGGKTGAGPGKRKRT